MIAEDQNGTKKPRPSRFGGRWNYASTDCSGNDHWLDAVFLTADLQFFAI